MIDIKLLQNNFEETAKKLFKKGIKSQDLENLKDLSLDAKNLRKNLEDISSKQNILSKSFGNAKKNGLETNSLQIQINDLKEEKLSLEKSLKDKEELLKKNLLGLANIPDDEVPIGLSEDENVVLCQVGQKPSFDFIPKEHWDLGEQNSWIDAKRGVKLAKTRFSALSGVGAKLERALINYMLEFNKKRGFEEWYVPFMVNSTALEGTGQLPKFAEDLFKIEGEDLYLLPTAEVALTNLYSDEIIQAEDLPLKLTAYTPCFRKEAGSAGRDTRGLIRQHQFDKVELVAITKPEQSEEMFEYMVQTASELLSSLGLAHQKVLLCGGDLGFSASKTIDLEVWLPGQNKYREISSISNTKSFQARRAKIRYKNAKKNELVHTLNGSSLAVGRTLVAIMENYQKENGDIEIPKVLEKYMG